MQGVTNGQVKACVHFPQNLMSLFHGQRGGLKPDESQKRGRAAGSLLPEITPSLIATVERSHRRITGTAWGCSLSAGSDEHKVPFTCSYLTGWLSASRALCLLHCQTEKKKKKSTLLASSVIVARTDKVVTDGWMCGWVGRDYSEEWAGRWVSRVADVYLCGR